MTPGSEPPPRGTDRLLGDCSRMGRVLAPGTPTARERLEAEVGEQLAAELVALVLRRAPANGR